MEGSRSPTFDGPRIYSPPTVYQPRSPDLFSDNAQDEEGWTTYYNPDITENAQQWNTPPPPSSQWHSVRRQLFQDTDSESDQTMTLWTFIYRGQPPKFDKNTRANCLYVDHEDHYHFVFESSTHNKNRSIHRIIQAGKLDINQNMSILSTLQPVVSWDKFAAYLIRSTNYSCICIGNKLKHLANNLKIVPREATDCATLLRNDRAGKTKFDNLKRKRRIDLMSELVEQNDARSINEFKNALTFDDRKNLYAEHGTQWKEAAELCIEAYCERLRKQQESTLFQSHILTNNHSRVCTHPRDTTSGELWLDRLLTANNINKTEILTSLTIVMNKRESRRNTFVLEGPTTTGKSLFLKLIAENYIYGTVQRNGDHSQFFLMNLLNKSLALMEEPRWRPLYGDLVKDLQNWITKNFAAIRLNWQLLIGAPLKDMSDMIETLDKITYLPSYREEWTYTVEAKAHNLQQQSQISRVKWAAENIRDSAIEVPRYTGTLENFLETRAKTYPRTTPAPPINRPGPSRETTTSSDTATTTPRPTRPPHEDRPQVEAPRHVELPGKREEIHIKTEMDAKKPRMAGAGEDEGYSSGLAVAKHAHRLFGIHYYKTHVTITRKQHLTIAQYKPGESTISQFYITCLPYQLFEFWTINENGNGYREPAASIFTGFRYCAYDNASIRLSHFVPLQNTLQGSTQTDTPALNTTPYAYIARDTLGILDRVQATTPITATTLQAQQVKLKSNDYWQTENEEGLLGLSEIPETTLLSEDSKCQ
ncbi:uncharacterized protein DEA37_0004126 [Paragonimus westermani]|uniref:Parvovirus non-structural protein 1 helicase domain-containing protein n=1 Tax=Paragonimus westermani TaxID=34504 RepID=A0A5J4NXU7_9TREM|nr:uncharacterized protein DEA37_0004126 [Paragonimus westermani]